MNEKRGSYTIPPSEASQAVASTAHFKELQEQYGPENAAAIYVAEVWARALITGLGNKIGKPEIISGLDVTGREGLIAQLDSLRRAGWKIGEELGLFPEDTPLIIAPFYDLLISFSGKVNLPDFQLVSVGERVDRSGAHFIKCNPLSAKWRFADVGGTHRFDQMVNFRNQFTTGSLQLISSLDTREPVHLATYRGTILPPLSFNV